MDNINIIRKNTREIQSGIEDIITRYIWIREYLNNGSAYTKAECSCRLELMKEREVIERTLRMIGIQDFEIKEYNKIELV